MGGGYRKISICSYCFVPSQMSSVTDGQETQEDGPGLDAGMTKSAVGGEGGREGHQYLRPIRVAVML